MTSSHSWYQQLVDLLKTAGSAEFFPALTQCLHTVVNFDCSGVMLYDGKQVTLLYQGGFSKHYQKYIDLYLSGLYHLDPHYSFLSKGAASGLYRFKDIAPDCYHDTEYYQAFIKPVGITDEYDFIIDTDDGHIDFFMNALGGSFTQQESAALADIAPMIIYALQQHWRKHRTDAGLQQGAPAKQSYQNIFDAFGSSILTKREQEVIQCILHGHSSKSLAAKLNISPSTVKIHRKNIYQKLDINSQSELFSLCIQSLSIKELYNSEDPLSALIDPSSTEAQ